GASGGSRFLGYLLSLCVCSYIPSMNNSLQKIESSKTLLGFWVYLMTDMVLFAALFATFVVLRGSIEGLSGGLFSMPTVLVETLILLTSSFTCGLALLLARANKKSLVLVF